MLRIFIGMELSKEKQEVLNNIVNDLKKINGVVAVVLGGSYAAGKATKSSDLDIGIYYAQENPFSITDIKAIANKYSISENPTVTNFYEWGPWVNGGAWIHTSCGKVDFLYRNLEQVTTTIAKAKNGEWENHFEQQPPYGFSSIIYLAEIKACIPLHDPNVHFANLKKEIQNYPAKLKDAVIGQSLWSAEFTIWHAEYFFAKNEDIYNTAGCLSRAVKNIVTALFAVNEIYPLGDKRAITILEKAPKCPHDLKEKIDGILTLNKNAVGNNIDLLKTLFKETVELSKENYKPFPYNLSRE
jgi:predicted nucleotidyltransferase